MNKRDLKKLDNMRNQIAKKRDELRSILEDYRGLIDSVETGCDYLDNAEEHLRDAVDALSEQV